MIWVEFNHVLVLLKPIKDILAFTTRFRLVQSIKGQCFATIKHRVRTIHEGRHTLGIIYKI